ncbi:P-loop containing nucleoside triphosphate hydrolase protein [Gloeopeniophorella convolvens]|nr:P-loop containing nucleoside triphosphate hydrolase protein [Gloeopeniophorella convolvens]
MPTQRIIEFLDRHLSLLARERDAEVERSSLVFSRCGPKLLEQKGLALNGLGVASVSIGLGSKTLVELERPTAYHTSINFPPHTFRPGDLASIEDNGPATFGKAKKASKTSPASGKLENTRSTVEGVVYKVADTRIVISVDPSRSDSNGLEIPERCRVLKLANSVTYDRELHRMESTLMELKRIVDPSAASDAAVGLPTRLAEVLLGVTMPSPSIPLHGISFFDDSLNDSQKEAVKFALESPEVACIHGPPGTGKTHTLIEIIRQLTSVTPVNPKPLRMLVCGASNLSVDNILERLLALPVLDKGARLRVTRIGHPARVMAHEGVFNATLEAQADRSDQAALARDVKAELEATLGVLSGKGKGVKSPRGLERKKMWEEVRALRKEYRQRESGVTRTILRVSQVVLATCHSSGGHQLRNQDFDVVVIDEATQALEAACWIPIFKAKKLVLAGDPRQLPPTILSSPTSNKSSGSKKMDSSTATKKTATSAPSKVGLSLPRTLEFTMFERLEKMYGPGIKRMLTIQYRRMHTKIADFPSKAMYSSKLVTHSSVASSLLSELPNTKSTSEEDTQEVLGTPVVFFDTAGCEYFERLEGDGDEGSKCNENEATIVKNWVETLVEAGVSQSQIAIITPYQAQVTLLSSLLRPVHGLDLEIGTVDGMQGREKEAVIISLVRSNDQREVGFLKEKRRLNVAMTRARRHLCVVGDSSTVQHGGKYLKDWLTWLEENADVRYAALD